jgi:RNA polymerase sigma-70 factor (ECF subfamily)
MDERARPASQPAPQIDDALVAAARRGDEQALDALLARIEPLVYRFGRKLCQRPEDAQAVLQETMLTLVRSLHDFRGESSLTTWLYAVARSHCSKLRRRERHEPPMTSLDSAELASLAGDAPDPAEALAQRQLGAALDQAIRGLDEKYRDVLVLRDVEGLPAAEVAQMLGLGVAAVKSRLHRARAAVRAELARRLGEPPPAPPGAACPDVLTLLSRKLEGELTPAVCAEVERHVEGCARCRAECDALRDILAVCSASPLPRVPDHVRQAVRRAARQALARPR